MAELLLELFSEEIPARMQQGAATQLKQLAEKRFQEEGLSFQEVNTYVTPRRLVLHVKDLGTEQPARTEEKRGPRVDAPAAAIQGFLTSTGMTLEQCEKRDTPKGPFLFAHQTIEGKKTLEILPTIIADWVSHFHWPKSMRWNDMAQTWVRPLRSLLCLYDGQVVPLDIHGLKSSNQTLGHRFLSKDPITVSSFDLYKEALEKAYVVLDWQTRRKMIADKVTALAQSLGLRAVLDEALLDEVAGLTEWPEVLAGTMDDAFMNLPREVIITPMRVHQRYFATEDSAGNLANRFIVVANTVPTDEGNALRKGNERVLRARLEDAQFYWEDDLKTPLEGHALKLDRLVYYKGLGTLADKAARLVSFSACFNFPQADFQHAATLCKADLVTGIVGEFPEVQGTMGRYYAKASGYTDAIAVAIEEHYLPKGSQGQGQGDLPSSPLGTALALADRVDMLVGFFALGIQPTGSKDPLALRRAGLGVIHLLLNGGLEVSITALLQHAWMTYEHAFEGLKDPQAELKTFLLERFKYFLRDQDGSPYDHVEAVLALSLEDIELDFRDLRCRVQALDKFLETSAGQDLLASYKRAANILRAEEKKASLTVENKIQETYLIENVEVALWQALQKVEPQIQDALQKRDYVQAMTYLATVRHSMDDFFNTIRVNAEEATLRANRLTLLAYFRTLLHRVADFSKLEG